MPYPDQQWMAQQARNVTLKDGGFLAHSRYLLHDRDGKLLSGVSRGDPNRQGQAPEVAGTLLIDLAVPVKHGVLIAHQIVYSICFRGEHTNSLASRLSFTSSRWRIELSTPSGPNAPTDWR